MKTLWSWTLPAVSLAVVIALGGCAEKRVSRVETGKEVDLSGKWNDTDSQMVSKDMITDAMSYPWADKFSKQHAGKNPVVIVYGVKNRSSEIINTQTFMRDLEHAFIRSGRVDVVASPEERTEIRGERAEQQQGFTANPAAIGKELGADFVLTGVLNSIEDRLGNQEVRYYQTNLQLISVETNLKVWDGENKIKKEINRSSTKF